MRGGGGGVTPAVGNGCVRVVYFGLAPVSPAVWMYVHALSGVAVLCGVALCCWFTRNSTGISAHGGITRRYMLFRAVILRYIPRVRLGKRLATWNALGCFKVMHA